MKLAKALEEKRMDIRIVDRLQAEGKVTKSEVDTYFGSLADDTDNFERVNTEEDKEAETEADSNPEA